MSDPQIWVMLGLFSTLFFGMVRLNNGAIVRRLDAKIDGVEERLDAKIDGVGERLDAKIDGVEERLGTRIDALTAVTDVRFNEVGRRLDALETDMGLVKAHLIGRASA